MSDSVVIYPYFGECKNFTIDTFWKDVLTSCSKNKFPKGSRYNGNFLLIRSSPKGKKYDSFGIPSVPEKACPFIIGLFREKLELFSPRDLRIQKKNFDNFGSCVDLDCDWKRLKPRSVRDVMICNFVIRMKQERNLTEKQCKRLLLDINLGFQLKRLKADDVNYENRAIQNIRGLEFDGNSWDIVNVPKVGKSERMATPQRIYREIDRFAKEYKAQRFRI